MGSKFEWQKYEGEKLTIKLAAKMLMFLLLSFVAIPGAIIWIVSHDGHLSESGTEWLIGFAILAGLAVGWFLFLNKDK